MGSTPIGANFWEGPLKVVRITWDNVDMGKTTADTELTKTEDVKDIIYQQDGTQYHDKIPTGVSWMLTCTLGEITTARLDKLHDAVTQVGNSLKMGKALFHSWREQAAQLEVFAVDEDGDASSDVLQRMIAPLAYPEITGPIQYGADTQRSLPVTFHIFYDTTENVFFYSGYASSLGLTP
jgi:hypothetical protein